MSSEFAGKVAIVTGAASGIGAAVAQELAAAGASVVVADMDMDSAQKTEAAIRQAGGQAAAFRLDVAEASEVAALVAFTEKTFGGLHLAVNNAGIGGPSAPTADYPLDDWKKIIDVNLNSVFFCMKYQIAAMLRSGGGAIVNMASILGSVGFSGSSAYVTAKHGLIGLTKAAAIEYATKGIRVTAVGPGFIATPLLSRNLDAVALAAIADLHPVKRLGRPAEVAALTCFLLSERASFITGSYHLVDGGYVAQ